MLSNQSAFTSPYDYREMMMAVVGYSDRTVDEVLEAQEARRKDQTAQAKSGKKSTPRVGASVQPKQSELDKMNEMIANARKAAEPVNLDDPSPPK